MLVGKAVRVDITLKSSLLTQMRVNDVSLGIRFLIQASPQVF